MEKTRNIIHTSYIGQSLVLFNELLNHEKNKHKIIPFHLFFDLIEDPDNTQLTQTEEVGFKCNYCGFLTNSTMEIILNSIKSTNFEQECECINCHTSLFLSKSKSKTVKKKLIMSTDELIRLCGLTEYLSDFLEEDFHQPQEVKTENIENISKEIDDEQQEKQTNSSQTTNETSENDINDLYETIIDDKNTSDKDKDIDMQDNNIQNQATNDTTNEEKVSLSDKKDEESKKNSTEYETKSENTDNSSTDPKEFIDNSTLNDDIYNDDEDNVYEDDDEFDSEDYYEKEEEDDEDDDKVDEFFETDKVSTSLTSQNTQNDEKDDESSKIKDIILPDNSFDMFIKQSKEELLKLSKFDENQTDKLIHAIKKILNYTNNEFKTKINVIIEKDFINKEKVLIDQDGVNNLLFNCPECSSALTLNIDEKYTLDIKEVVDTLLTVVSVEDPKSGLTYARYMLNCPFCIKNLTGYKTKDDKVGIFNRHLQWCVWVSCLMYNSLVSSKTGEEFLPIFNKKYYNLTSFYDEIDIGVFKLNGDFIRMTSNSIKNTISAIVEYENYKKGTFAKIANAMKDKFGWDDKLDPHFNDKGWGFENAFMDKNIDKIDLKLTVKPKKTKSANSDVNFYKHVTLIPFDKSVEEDIVGFGENRKMNNILRILSVLKTDSKLREYILQDSLFRSNTLFDKTIKYEERNNNTEKVYATIFDTNETKYRFEKSVFHKILDFIKKESKNIKILHNISSVIPLDIFITDIISITKRNEKKILRILWRDIHNPVLDINMNIFDKIPFGHIDPKTNKPYELFHQRVIYSDSCDNLRGVCDSLDKTINDVKPENVIKLSNNNFQIVYETDMDIYQQFSEECSPTNKKYQCMRQKSSKFSPIDGCIVVSISMDRGLVKSKTNRTNAKEDLIVQSARLALSKTKDISRFVNDLNISDLFFHEKYCAIQFYSVKNESSKVITYYITNYIEKHNVSITDGIDTCISCLFREHLRHSSTRAYLPLFMVEYDNDNLPPNSLEKSLIGKNELGEYYYTNMVSSVEKNTKNILENKLRKAYLHQTGANTNMYYFIPDPSSMEYLQKQRYDARYFKKPIFINKIFGDSNSDIKTIMHDSNLNDHQKIYLMIDKLQFKAIHKLPVITFQANKVLMDKIITLGYIDKFKITRQKNGDFIIDDNPTTTLFELLQTIHIKEISKQITKDEKINFKDVFLRILKSFTTKEHRDYYDSFDKMNELSSKVNEQANRTIEY